MQKEIDFPVRVLMVFRRLFSGGSQHFIMNQYRAIDRTKVQFDFVVHGDEAGIFESEVKDLGGKIYRCPYIYNGVNHISYCKWWKRFYGSHPEYKIVYGHLMSTASIYLYYAKKTGKVTICHSHSSSNGKGFSAVIKDMMQYPIRYIADYKFACSEDAGKWLYGNNIINNRNFMVIPIGIDLKRFKYSESKRNEIRNALNLKGRYVIGHIGRFETVKNHTFLIDLFSVLLKQLPDAKLLLVGDGSMRKNIEKKCIRLGIRTNVVFAGSRTNPEEFYQAAWILVLV